MLRNIALNKIEKLISNERDHNVDLNNLIKEFKPLQGEIFYRLNRILWNKKIDILDDLKARCLLCKSITHTQKECSRICDYCKLIDCPYKNTTCRFIC